MKKILLLLVLFVLTGCSSSDGDSDTEIVVSLPETFGVWTPSFTDQTSNFDQTRNGNQGTQQTRTITVTSSSNTSSSNEEIINEDINSDGDLFEEIEIIVITYTGSENLGSHEVTTYNIIEDNDMGITVGNDFYPLSGGYLFDYGLFNEVENCNSIYNIDLYLYSDGIQFINTSLQEFWSTLVNDQVIVAGCHPSSNMSAFVYTPETTTLTTENFVGIMNGATLDTASGEILSSCNVARNLTSLTPGQTYFVTPTGALSETAGNPSVTAGTAISSTELIVKG